MDQVECPRPRSQPDHLLLQPRPMPKGQGQLVTGAKVPATGKPNALQPFGTKDLQFRRTCAYPTIAMEDNPTVLGDDGHPLRVQGTQGDPRSCLMSRIKDIVALT